MKYGKYKYKVNENFFSIPNILNCYWAGFIAADGNISKSCNSLKIMLSIKDLEHLKNFNNDIQSNYLVRIVEKIKSCNLLITRPQIKEDLKRNFSIVPNKTFIYNFPNIKEKELIDAFIVGYIDGDGCISLLSKRKNKIQLSICGTKVFLEWCKKRFCEILKVQNFGCIGKDRNIHQFASSGENVLNLLYHYNNFYIKHSLPVLQRKWNKIKDARTTFGQYMEWSEKEKEILKNLHSSKTVKEIWKQFFSNRSYTSVEKECHYLGLKKHFEKKWEDWEEKLIIENYEKMTLKEIWNMYFLNYRTFNSLKGKIKMLGEKNVICRKRH